MTIRWYFCHPEAKPLPFPSAINSLNWYANDEREPLPLGEEVGAPRPWSNGHQHPLPRGDHYHGEPEWFLTGCPPGIITPRDATGLPLECVYPNVPLGGLVFGGSNPPQPIAPGISCQCCPGGQLKQTMGITFTNRTGWSTAMPSSATLTYGGQTAVDDYWTWTDTGGGQSIQGNALYGRHMELRCSRVDPAPSIGSLYFNWSLAGEGGVMAYGGSGSGIATSCSPPVIAGHAVMTNSWNPNQFCGEADFNVVQLG